MVDHIQPFKNGGWNCPANMQWKTKEVAKAKDKWELPGKRKTKPALEQINMAIN